MLAAALCTALLAKAARRELRAHAYARKKKKISEANAKLMSRASFTASSESKKKKQGERTTQSLGDDPVYYFCFTTALLLLYYCFTTDLLLFYYCFITRIGDKGLEAFRVGEGAGGKTVRKLLFSATLTRNPSKLAPLRLRVVHGALSY